MIQRFIILSSVLSLGVSTISCGSQQILNPIINNSPVYSQQNTVTRFYDTAKENLWMVENKAREWDISARLIKVEGHNINERGETNSWTYYFKSPFKQKILRIIGSEAREVNEIFFGHEFNDFSWRIDSSKAIEIAKNHGLKKFPVLDMTLEDRFNLEWQIRSWDGYYRINAETGEVQKTKTI